MSEISTVSAADLMTRPDRRWVLTLASICGVILAYGVFMSTNKNGNVAFLVGENAVYGLFIFVVFRVISGRKTTRELGAYAYVAILSALVAASLIGAARQNAPMKRSAARLSQGVSPIVDSSVDAQGNPKIIDTVLDTKTIESGEAGERGRFIKTYINNGVALRNDFAGALQAIGWPDIMDKNRIAKDTGLVQSFQMLAKADGLLRTYKDKIHALEASARQEISTLPIEDSTKTKMRKDFDEGLHLSPLETQLDILERCDTEYRAIFQLMKDTQGQWAVNNGKFEFERARDVAVLQAHAETVAKSIEQAQTLEQEWMTAAQSAIKGGSPP